MAISTENSNNWTIAYGTAAEVAGWLDSQDVGPAQVVGFTFDGSSGNFAVIIQP